MDIKHKKIIAGIKEYFQNSGFSKAVIGLSGGIDSSLAAALAAEAIGKDNVTALLMPEEGLSSKENLDHAKEVAKKIGIKHLIIPINHFLTGFQDMHWKQNDFAKINTKSRIRAVILYNYANTHKALVIGTSNKTEILLGYFTKYGDGAVDIEVIGELWKTGVYQMAKHLNLPDFLQTKQPTAELYHGQTDEQELGGKYSDIDEILKMFLSQGFSAEQIIKEGFSQKLVENIVQRIKDNEHKRFNPPVIKV